MFCYFRSEREEFIKRKWIDREFVAGLVVRGGSPGSASSSRRRWSVRKLRRRGRSNDGKNSSLTPSFSIDVPPEQDPPTKIPPPSEASNHRASIVVVGDEESLPPSPGVDISSDEDSTSGTEETTSTGEESNSIQ